MCRLLEVFEFGLLFTSAWLDAWEEFTHIGDLRFSLAGLGGFKSQDHERKKKKRGPGVEDEFLFFEGVPF